MIYWGGGLERRCIGERGWEWESYNRWRNGNFWYNYPLAVLDSMTCGGWEVRDGVV